jgi:hypothetical protein
MDGGISSKKDILSQTRLQCCYQVNWYCLLSSYCISFDRCQGRLLYLQAIWAVHRSRGISGVKFWSSAYGIWYMSKLSSQAWSFAYWTASIRWTASLAILTVSREAVGVSGSSPVPVCALVWIATLLQVLYRAAFSVQRGRQPIAS